MMLVEVGGSSPLGPAITVAQGPLGREAVAQPPHVLAISAMATPGANPPSVHETDTARLLSARLCIA